MNEDYSDLVEIYIDDAGEWRWRRKSSGNHEVIATSGEGYVSKGHANKMAHRVNGNSCRFVTLDEEDDQVVFPGLGVEQDA